MIARNAEKLRHLSLGFTTCIAHDFAHSQSPRHDMMSTSFAVDLRDTLSESDLEPLINLSLESLSLCGLDLGGVIWGETALYVNFNNITQLRLESCSGLSQAFSLFNVQIGFSKLALGALQDLFLRIEDPDPNLTTSLETFLTAVRGLTSLKVLIDKVAAVQDLEPILKVHGKTLRTLVWDERHGSRKRFDVCTSPMSPKLGHLSVVSRNCPSLKLLGIPLDWDTISSSDEKVHEEVA